MDPTSSIPPDDTETPNRTPVPEGTPLLCMSEANTTAVWSYNGEGKPGALRLISVEKVLDPSNNAPSIDLYEWEQSLLSWPRDGSVLVDSFNGPPGMPPYAAISHTWKQTDEVIRRGRDAERPLLISTGLETPHEISWLGLVQAATAARSLFCEYLWLDLLCLDQLSKKDKKLQIANMRRIYANARAVLVMAGGVSAAQPLEQTSDWISRAWTLQEATLCYETWVLVEWDLPGPKVFPRSDKYLEHKDLEGDIKIFRLRQLLSHQPGQVLGEAREHGAEGDQTRNPQFFDVEIVIKCFGTERLFTSALDAAVTAKEISTESSESDSKSESDKSVSHVLEPDPTDPYGKDLSPWKKVPKYFEDFHRLKIQYAAAWRSMWLRTSTKEQDMVFSTAHIIGAKVEVDYGRQLNDLIYDVVQQVSVPAWLTIGDGIPVMPESGLIPMLPIFTAQNQPCYRIRDEVVPAASLVKGDYYCFKYDIEIKSLGMGQGHMICARMFDVVQVANLAQEPGKSKLAYSCEIRLSCSGLQLYTVCKFQGRMGSLMAIVGNGREWDVDHGSDFYPNPYVCLLDQNENGVWVKTGAGTIKDNLFYELEELARISRRHLRVGGDQAFVVSGCDCGKSSPLRCLPACTYTSQEEMDRALSLACNAGSQMKIRQLLELGATTEDNESALSNACARGNIRIVELLIEKGANVKALGASAIQGAVSFGNHLIVELLIKMGVDIHASADGDWLPLHLAAQQGYLESARLLLEAGADANALLRDWDDPLSLAMAKGTGSLEMCELLIRHGANIHGNIGAKNNPLIQAAFYKELNIVQLLLDQGADVNAQWEDNYQFPYALHAACRFPGTDVPKILLEHGAEPNAQGGQFGTALGVAAHHGNLPICELLIAHGADVNVQGGDWGTALQAAGPRSYPKGSSRNEKVMLFLIENGADIHAQGGRYGNALQAAAYGGKDEAIRVMIERGANVNASGGKYGSALQAAAHKGRRMTAKLLIDAGADANVEPDYIGRLKRTLSVYVDIVQRLIDEGFDVNTTGGKYGSVLHAACCNDFQELLALLQEGVDSSKADSEESDDGRSDDEDHSSEDNQYETERSDSDDWTTVDDSQSDQGISDDDQSNDDEESEDQEVSDDEDMSDDEDDDDEQKLATITSIPPEDHLAIVTILIKHGARIEVVAGYYGTTLQAVAVSGNEEVVTVLLQHRASVKLEGGRYWTALQAAARHGHYNIVKRLVDAGTIINSYGGRHGSALQAACVYGHEAVAKYLISHGAELETPGNGWMAQWYRMMMGQHASPLLAAAHHGIEMVKPLLGIGADVNTVDSLGRNPLHIAAGKGDCYLMGILSPLLHVNDKKSEKDFLGRMYLHLAASSGSRAAVQHLLSLRANVNCVDNEGWTALHWASRKGTVSVIQQLIAAGADRQAKTKSGWTALDMAVFHRNLHAASLLAELAPVPWQLSAVIRQSAPGALGESIVGYEHKNACKTCQFIIFGERRACPKCRDFSLCFRCYGISNENHWKKYGSAHSVELVSLYEV